MSDPQTGTGPASEAPAIEDLVIREFQADDVDGLFFLEQRCYAAPLAMAYAQLRALLKDPAIATLVTVGETEGAPRMVAALIVRQEPAQQRLIVVSLMVDPDYRRVGLGRRLAAWAQRAAAVAGLPGVAVPLEAENGGGAAFLKALGFAPAESGVPFFNGPEDGAVWHRAVSAGEAP
jgi:ribosomal protein S18 acetylase RimI-like enzyme